MGTLLRSELVTEISSFFANRSDITSANIITWLNIAQTRMARVHKFQELEGIDTTAITYVGTPSTDKFFTLPTNTRKIYTVRLIDGSNSRKITVYTPQEFDKKIPYPEKYSTGRPSIAARWAHKLEWWKIPDKSYSIETRISKWPTAFLSSSDVVSDFDEKDDALIMLTVSWGYMRLRNMKDANFYWKVYSGMLNDIVGEEVENPDITLQGDTMGDGTLMEEPWRDPFVRSLN